MERRIALGAVVLRKPGEEQHTGDHRADDEGGLCISPFAPERLANSAHHAEADTAQQQPRWSSSRATTAGRTMGMTQCLRDQWCRLEHTACCLHHLLEASSPSHLAGTSVLGTTVTRLTLVTKAVEKSNHLAVFGRFPCVLKE